jgi:hypothetical protein
MARRRLADGEDGLQIWRVAVNILNKDTQTADKGQFSKPEGWASCRKLTVRNRLELGLEEIK